MAHVDADGLAKTVAQAADFGARQSRGSQRCLRRAADREGRTQHGVVAGQDDPLQRGGRQPHLAPEGLEGQEGGRGHGVLQARLDDRDLQIEGVSPERIAQVGLAAGRAIGLPRMQA